MKRQYDFLVVVLLCVLLAGCGSSGQPTPSAQPTPDTQATVDAQVQATIAARNAQTTRAAVPPTIDVEATVKAAVQLTMEAQPTATAEPTDTPPPADTPTPAPTKTATPRQVTATPTVSAVTATSGQRPIGKWMVRSYKTDDASAIFVNGEMVGATVYGRDSDWININDRLTPGQDTIVAFASYNGGAGGGWGFGIRRDDVSVWGVEQTTGDDWSLAYAQQVAIHPDGTVEAVPPDVAERKAPPGKWYVRVQNVQDIGSILVNGQPVAVFWNQEGGWIDITGLLYSDRDNKVTLATWNFDSAYSWDFAIKRDDTIVWGKQNAGSGATDRVYQEVVTISAEGELIEALPLGQIADSNWAVRSYKTDDASAIFVNGKVVGATVYGRDSDWINIKDQLTTGQDAIVAFASYNGGAGGGWGFGIRRDDITVWGVEQTTGDDWSLAYAQQIVIHPDGSIEPLLRDVSAKKPPPGKWYVRVQNVQDIGGILVNGQPVAVFWNQEGAWIDITGLLYSDQDNKIAFAAWNFDSAYSWDFAIKHDEDILWAVSNSGSGQTGVVLAQDIIMTGDGKLR